MAIIVPTAFPLRKSEYAYYLKEYNEFSGGRLMRMQSVAVVRDDKLVEFPQALGPASNFKDAEEIFIFGGFAETVDALMDYAMALREDNGLTTALQEHGDSSTLIQDYADSIEMRRHLGKTHQRTLRNLKANRSNL